MVDEEAEQRHAKNSRLRYRFAFEREAHTAIRDDSQTSAQNAPPLKTAFIAGNQAPAAFFKQMLELCANRHFKRTEIG